ncbi:MAG: TonB-dependent receptor [Flavobacteriales bacterium]|nr:TonB-dependent receptor [Flavobacteriales bacterium]
MKKVLTSLSFGLVLLVNAQQKQDSIQELNEVSIYSLAPTAKEIITKKEIEEKNLGQDLTYLIRNATSVVTTSDAGAGIGYTGVRVRGTDPTRINVTLNDIPLNDSESQGVFWVNMPNLATSTSAISIQRGVGTSSNGTSSFGASIGIQTDNNKEKPNAEIGLSMGSFDTQRYSVQFGTGKIAKNFYFDGGFSHINSDGYIDRASSDLYSYNYRLSYKKNKDEISFYNFGGKEKTYQAWYGIDKATMKVDRTRNYAGEIYDKNYNVIDTYNNQTDNYRQSHYHLTWKRELNNNWNLKNTLHYTKGKGYYEEYTHSDTLSLYRISSDIITSNLVRQKWLDNDFYGIQSHLIGKVDVFNIHAGVAGNQYVGDHFGKVTWVKDIPEFKNNGQKYYYNQSTKNEFSSFVKTIVGLNNFELFLDLQYRHIFYKAQGLNFRQNYNFFNPKAGITYKLPQGKLYFSYAKAQREPARTDLESSNNYAKPEKLHDFELGISKNFKKLQFQTNGYFMYYEDQLALTGEINDVGAFTRSNVGKSYRLGIENSMSYQALKNLNLFGNFSLSSNKILDYKETYIDEEEEKINIINYDNTDISFSPNFIANFGFDYSFLSNFNINWTSKYVSRQYLDNTSNFDRKLNNYFLSNIGLSYETKTKDNIKVRLNLLINNLLDKEYENNGYYDSEYGSYYYPQAGRNFLVGINLIW